MADVLDETEIRQRVKTILRRDLKLGDDMKIADDTPFFSAETDLDSLDMLLLVSSVEKDFGFKIPSEEVGQKAFQNVNSLTAFIAAKMGESGSARPAPRARAFLARLPHTDPFRFISKITEIRPGESAVGVWSVQGTEAFFAGHFPGNPIVPGVLISEALAQLSGIAGADEYAIENTPATLAHVDVRFDRPVIPPAEIELKSTVVRHMGQLQQFDVEATVGGKTVARGTIALHRPVSEPSQKESA